jgi:hypothetical protein
MAWLYGGLWLIGGRVVPARGELPVGQAWSAVPATHGVALRGVDDSGAFLAWCHAGGLSVGQASSAVPATHGVALRGVHDCGGFLRGAMLCGLPVGQASSVAPAMHGVALRGGHDCGAFLAWCRPGGCLLARCGRRSQPRMAWLYGGARLWGFPRVVPTWGAVRWSGVVGGLSHAWRGSTRVHDCGAFLAWCHPGGLSVGQVWSAVAATHGVALRGFTTVGAFLRGAILCGLPVGQASSAVPATRGVALRGP